MIKRTHQLYSLRKVLFSLNKKGLIFALITSVMGMIPFLESFVLGCNSIPLAHDPGVRYCATFPLIAISAPGFFITYLLLIYPIISVNFAEDISSGVYTSLFMLMIILGFAMNFFIYYWAYVLCLKIISFWRLR